MLTLCTWLHFNPHSPCGERLEFAIPNTREYIISIHTPLAGSDRGHRRTGHGPVISIHTPLAGSDQMARRSPSHQSHFNPHSPCGERPVMDMSDSTDKFKFQSTLPLRGATNAVSAFDTAKQFQSTLPLRGATLMSIDVFVFGLFQSTLPLRGATASSPASPHPSRNFNPHSPCGERPQK